MCSGVCFEDKSKSGKITLATTKKHLSVRETADKHYTRNVVRTQMKYCKRKHIKVRIISPGDFVSEKIPRIDRSSTDPRPSSSLCCCGTHWQERTSL